MTLQQAGTRVYALAGCALLAFSGWSAQAQNPPAEHPSATAEHPSAAAQAREARTNAPEITEIVFLSHTTGQNDMNDIQTALRNCFTWVKIYGVQGQNALAIKATPEEMQAVKKMIAELDRPKKIYRVTYNISDVENGRRTATQHYSMVLAEGARATLREGKRVPLVTGTTGENTTPASQNPQVQYVDVGVNIQASIEGQGLKTKVELSAVADEKSGIGAQDPVIQQTMLESTATLGASKPVVLGQVDVPGSTRHEEIDVTTELLP